MTEFWAGLGIVCIYFIICAVSAVLLRLLLPVPREVFRKTLHLILLGSLPVWICAYDTWWMAALSSLLFAAVVWPILAMAERLPGYADLLTERKHGEIKNSLLIVFAMFAAVITLCWGWQGDKLLAVAAVFAWGFGDAAAALIGKRFGRHCLTGRHIEGRKSLEGTIAMFAVSFVSVLAVLLFRGGLPWYGYMITAYATAAVSAIVELYSMNGNDTITCPLAATVVLLPLIHLFGGAH